MKPKILAVIPARGGSKGITRKNIRELAGKPLIAWTIEEAKKSSYIDRVILSSDDDEIIELAKRYGSDVPFVRPIELAQDDTPGIAPVLHAIEQCPGFDFIVVLQPTSPLRTVEDIDGAIGKLLKEGSDFCVSVSEVTQSPYWMYTLTESNVVQPIIEKPLILRRQDLPKVYNLNGAIYIAKITALKETENFITDTTTAYIMPEERSYDIDKEDDFALCESVLGKVKEHKE